MPLTPLALRPSVAPQPLQWTPSRDPDDVLFWHAGLAEHFPQVNGAATLPFGLRDCARQVNVSSLNAWGRTAVLNDERYGRLRASEHFGPADSYAFAHDPRYDGTELTVAAIVKWAGGTGIRHILSRFADSGGDSWRLVVNNGVALWQTIRAGQYPSAAASPLPTTRFAAISGSFVSGASARMICYVDGQPGAEFAPAPGAVSCTGRLWIGLNGNQLNNEAWDGWIAAIRVTRRWWTRAEHEAWAENPFRDVDPQRSIWVMSASSSPAVLPLASPTALSTPAAGQVHQGAVQNLQSATALATLAGSQAHQGVTALAATPTALSTPAGSQAHTGQVASAASATALAAVAGSGPGTLTGAVAPLASPTALGTAAGQQQHAGQAATAATPTALSTAAGSQVHSGQVASAASATALATVAGSGPGQATGAGAPLASPTALAVVAGSQIHVGAVAAASSAASLGAVAGFDPNAEPLRVARWRAAWQPLRRCGNASRSAAA
jgi:hypothetical protein